MSITIGSENNFILDMFIYYQTMEEWKNRFKKMFRKQRNQVGNWKQKGPGHFPRSAFQHRPSSTASTCYDDINNNPPCKNHSNSFRNVVKSIRRFSMTKPLKFYKMNAVFKDMFSEKQTSCNEDTEWNQSDKNYIRVRPRKELKHSFSYDQINGSRDVSIKLDVLRRFSKKSIIFKQEKSRMRQMLDDVGTGADVKPPRNEWRTLKLSKHTDQDFGFSTQKYTFQKCDGTVENRVFVDNVIDEGSAYLGGLRKGDVILKVNNEKVEDIDYNKILEHIQGDKDQLEIVVKYMDAVNHRALTESLKEKEAELAARKLLLEKLEKEIEELYSLNLNEYDSDKEDINRSSIYSNASDNGLNTSDLSDDIEIKIRETEIFPSCDSLEQIEFLGINELSIETDLLDSYSEKNKNGPTVRRAESMPVQKNKSNLNFKFKTTNEEYRISDIIEEHNCVNQNVNCEETRNDNGNSIHISNRTKSYKKAIKYKTKI